MKRFIADTTGDVRDVVVVGVVALEVLARCGRRAADFFSRAGVRSPDKACRQARAAYAEVRAAAAAPP